MLLNNKAYNVLKFCVQILFPASASLYFALAQIWGLPKVEEVVGTITSLTVFIGLLLGLSSKTYNNSEAKYDGSILLENHPDGGSQIRLQQIDPDALLGKRDLMLKINQ
jgi:hypothetical protein